ncbi:hypothetical protein [Neobacillus sp. D3-1R]|uniref:hypothetical protein n=1 Tax=Neobacillus sp. D3-1R TaxID=3445778 RepID=UPI003FA04A9E
MKRFLLAIAIVAMLQTVFVGVAGAEYLQKSDQTISVNTGLGLYSPLNTGSLTFKTQEAIHDLLGDTTGLDVDHYYLWVEVDGNQLLGVDPIRAMY